MNEAAAKYRLGKAPVAKQLDRVEAGVAQLGDDSRLVREKVSIVMATQGPRRPNGVPPASRAEVAKLVEAAEKLTQREKVLREHLVEIRDRLLSQLFALTSELDAYRAADARRNNDDLTRVHDRMHELRSELRNTREGAFLVGLDAFAAQGAAGAAQGTGGGGGGGSGSGMVAADDGEDEEGEDEEGDESSSGSSASSGSSEEDDEEGEDEEEEEDGGREGGGGSRAPRGGKGRATLKRRAQ
jgi:hypothetical protein